jgi:cysteine desulfurase/selenocysteine lyase
MEKRALEAIRADFPILQRKVNGKPLVYLDHAATSQKPSAVIERMNRYYREENANIHRGVHRLSQEATEAYEGARKTVADFLGAASDKEIVFTKGATEAINLIAHGLGQSLLEKGDTVLVSEMEHHANIVPWQLLEQRMGIQLVPVAVTDDGELDLADFAEKLNSLKPKLVSIVHVSNSLGTINPVETIIAQAHAAGAQVLIDGCQSVPHFPVDVKALGCDWMVCSGHKLGGPTGIGILYGKWERLTALPPYQGGGDMIERVSFAGTDFKEPPSLFEAGTPPIAEAIGLAAGIDYLCGQDRAALLAHEEALREMAEAGLAGIPDLRIIGTAKAKASVVSFVHDSAHPHDIASFLDADGIAVRTGHHCTQPLMIRYGLPGTVRASFSYSNTPEEVEQLVQSVKRVVDFFA